MFEMPKYAEAIGDIETGNSTWTIPAWKSGLIIGGATFSGLFGCLAFGTISDRLGRRLSLVIATSFIILASISQAVFIDFGLSSLRAVWFQVSILVVFPQFVQHTLGSC